MMNRSRHQHSKHLRQPAGFTLVEMLVSVTLVLLMMTMFASIFQMATDSVSKQRGIAENDQRARTLTTIIRADFAKRTNRYPLPYYQGENSATSPTPFGNRPGYLYISTNDTYSGLDDKVQWTVSANNISENTDATPYFGASKLLYDAIADANGDARRTTIRFNPNQPEADDGQIFANNVSSSSAAEVCYFVRNGNLIRRVMLLREPLPIAGEDYSIQPASTYGDNPYFIDEANGTIGRGDPLGGQFSYVATPGAINQTDSSDADHFALAAGDAVPSSWNVTTTNDFWRHFDFSAIPSNYNAALPGANRPDNVQFIGVDSLSNESAGSTTFSIGKPSFRFGFNPVTGLSREHEHVTDRTALFLGTFLQAETSDENFNWPIGASRDDRTGGSPPAIIGNGNPMDVVNTPLTLNQATGVVTQFDGSAGNFGRGGGRQVEDLLLSNVHEFRIEIWDDRMGRWVVPGHAGSVTATSPNTQGDYNINRRLNTTYGPKGGGITDSGTYYPDHVFDTWHPGMTTGTGHGLHASSVSLIDQDPPYIAYQYYPPRRGDSPPGPSADTMQDPLAEIDPLTGTATNKGYWQPSDFTDPMNPIYQNYSVGDVVFVPWIDAPQGATPPDGMFQYNEIAEPKFHIAYRCVVAGYAGDSQPTWPKVADKRISEALAGGTCIWESIDNRRPLKSIRMTIRFFDQNTQNIRQVKLVLPLTAQ